ncbi:hypothetical protein [Mycobacterium riyadhense]|nr:hypothetical protein [Mycobacterium riyadhense]MCV7145802.1 hypothetical protein [Mycobacterium riyadhense]
MVDQSRLERLRHGATGANGGHGGNAATAGGCSVVRLFGNGGKNGPA